MKFKHLILLVALFAGSLKAYSQCGTPVTSVSENFNSTFPACWATNGSHIFNTVILNSSGNVGRYIVLPLVDNANGILEFDALNSTNGQAGPGSFQFGVSSVTGASVMSDFQLVQTLDIYATISGPNVIFAHYVVDYSAYAGTDQYIVIYMNGSSDREVRFDNITYQSACISQSVTALAQDVTVQLNVFGTASVSTSMVDNGSTSDCGTPTLSLSQTDFDCSHVGVNQVTFTADDGWGNVDNQVINVTVVPSIDDETVNATQSSLCSGGSTTITTGGSNAGISYYLRNDADNSIIAGPTVGTGSGISFNTGNLSSTTTFNVFAESPGSNVSSALDFDGTNDYVNVPSTAALNYEQGFTFEARLKANSGGSRAIFSAGTAGTSDIEIYVQGSSNRLVVVYNRASSGYTLAAKEFPVPPLNTWFDLAVTYDGATTKVYYDGVEQTALATTNGSPLHKTTGSQFDFGFMRSNINNNWGFATHLGVFDEVRLWDNARSASDILASVNTCSDGSGAGLVALYPFNEGSGIVVSDIVGGNNGTMVNMAANDWVTGAFACNIPANSSCDLQMSQTVTVTVGDALAPVPNVSTLSTITSQCEVTSLTAPTATDNCAGPITATHNANLPLSASTTITWTYDDGNGNTSTQTQDVVINDNTAPVPNSGSLSALTAQCEVTALTAPTATDNCAGAITATHNVSLPLSASTTITWTYDDGNGNTSTQTQDVVINDNTAPVPNVASLPTLTEYCELANVVDPIATDNCAGSLFGTATLNLPITSSTTITWTYDDGNGNTATQIQDVVILDIDVATTENGGTITADQSGATYQWVDCDNSNAPIQGETGQDFTPMSSGNYAVEVTMGNCTETSACVNMMVTGVEEASEATLGVYPVPAQNELNVVCSQNIEGLVIYSANGQQIRSYGQQTNRIDISDLPNGMYLLVVQTENGPLQRRFIKE